MRAQDALQGATQARLRDPVTDQNRTKTAERGSAVFAKQVQLASLARATAVIKEEIKVAGKVQKQDSVMHSESVPNRIFTGGVRVLVIALALVFIIMGIANGGMADVLSKAVKICTECIGLG